MGSHCKWMILHVKLTLVSSSKAQYIFIHDAILESVLCGDTSIPASDLSDRLDALSELDPESQRIKIEVEFEVRTGDQRNALLLLIPK